MYDYIIVGGGPTAITLALTFLHTNYKILIVEKSNSLGGCWKSSFNKLLFNEHSPKVILKHNDQLFDKLLASLQIDPKYENVYHNALLNTMRMSFYIFQHLNMIDILTIFKYMIQYFSNTYDNHISVHDWMLENNISIRGKKCLTYLSILLANGPKQLRFISLMYALFLDMNIVLSIKQLSYPNEWIRVVTDKITKSNNITLQLNTQIVRVESSNGKARSVIVNDKTVEFRKDIFLCVPLNNLYEIMKSSDLLSNWRMNPDEFKYYVDRSTLVGLGIQFHFKSEMKFPKKWWWASDTPWNIICINKNKTLNTISRDNAIQSVWSIALVDRNSKSNNNKSINDCMSKKEISDEVIQQLQIAGNIKINPDHISYGNFYKNNNTWISENTAFTDVLGPLQPTGIIHNLHAVGPHNIPRVAEIHTAVQSATNIIKLLNLPIIF